MKKRKQIKGVFLSDIEYKWKNDFLYLVEKGIIEDLHWKIQWPNPEDFQLWEFMWDLIKDIGDST